MKIINTRLCNQILSRNKFYISTPIFYVNSSPHLGHVYTAVISDAAHRFQKLLGVEQTIFSTGTDEHGLKVQQAAQKNNIDPLKYCDRVSNEFKTLFDKYSVHYTDYIRTTEERHTTAVNTFFRSIEQRGYIYKSNYEGWYCTTDETFLTGKQIKKIIKDGKELVLNAENEQPAEWTSESNYIFKLSHFQDDLLYWLKKEDRVIPSRFQDELKIWISNGLYDLSISRPKSRVSWGIPMPDNEEQTIYVWLDALANYLTVSGYPELYQWPPNLQVLGKDILRFHGIYWPALLMAANLEPPEKLLVHCHLQVDGVKMSKSLGNIVCPNSLLDIFGPDAVRYVLLRSGTFHSDGSWCNTRAAQCVNAELANTLGNLLNRCVAPALNPSGLVPKFDKDFLLTASSTCKSLLSLMERLPNEVQNHFSNHNYNVGVDAIMNMIRTANGFIEEERPWELKNNPDRTKLDSILYVGLIAIRAAAICLQPIVPNYADTLLNILNIPNKERMWEDLDTDFLSVFSAASLGKREIPFKKLKLG